MPDKAVLSRRNVLKAGAAAGVLGAGGMLAPGTLHAAAEMKGRQVPGYYRFKLGAFEITVLSDGSYTLPTNLLGTNVPREQVTDFLKANFLDPDQRVSHVNVPLINTGEKLVLVDVGGGMNWMPDAGKLTDNLRASGYEPEDVDLVVITHGHPDHIWGLIDEFEDAPRFPNAGYVMAAQEWDFWMGDKAKQTLPEMFHNFIIGAQNRLPRIAEKTRRIKPGEDVVTGIVTLDTPGHTGGHISLAVTSKDKSLVVTADTMTHPFISFEHPGWWPRTDMDQAMAEKSRRKLLEMAATDGHLALVYHVSFPGLGRVARAGQAYRWVPENWKWEL
jgi:glyoxylase-like metal-dependent hydrolase (beta-lactamase superfamily II)